MLCPSIDGNDSTQQEGLESSFHYDVYHPAAMRID